MQKNTLPTEMSIIWKEVTDSTNSDAVRGKRIYPDKTVWAADFQTSGRGQRGNVWKSQLSENLMFSVLLKPICIPASRQFLISQAASVAMVTYLSEHNIPAKIKWPNDIYVGNSKICGMLIENSVIGDKVSVSIIGVGLNVNQTHFDDDIPNPVSMTQCADDIHFDRKEELSRYLSVFFQIYDSISDADAVLELENIYLDYLYRKGEWHFYQEKTSDGSALLSTIEGRIIGVDKETSRLKLETRDGKIKMYAFKEIAYVL